MNIVEKISQDQIDKVVEGRPVPEFGPGDTLKVHVKVVEGTRERVERVFPLYSPRIDQIEVVRRGRVRRAKLYYLRGRRGKSARIAEKIQRTSKSSES